MLRVYITGSRGYIGSYLTKYLEKQDVDVVHNECDIRDYNLLLKELLLLKPHVVIHLAACSTVEKCQKDYQLALQVNVVGTKNLLRAMHESKCDKIIYASTCAVYGNKSYKVSENDSLLPLSHYGYTKLLGEHVISNDNNINSVIFRMTNVCGFNKYLKSERFLLFDILLKKTIKDETFCIYGNNYPTTDGTCSRDYISLDDVCYAYYLALMKLHFKILKKQHIFNLCSNRNYSVKEVLYNWQEHLQKNNRKALVVVNSEARTGDVTSISLNNYKIRDCLYWHVNKKLDDIVESYIKEL